eukprot:6211777-Pleurochrysis_carterae.AAC.4
MHVGLQQPHIAIRYRQGALWITRKNGSHTHSRSISGDLLQTRLQRHISARMELAAPTRRTGRDKTDGGIY